MHICSILYLDVHFCFFSINQVNINESLQEHNIFLHIVRVAHLFLSMKMLFHRVVTFVVVVLLREPTYFPTKISFYIHNHSVYLVRIASTLSAKIVSDQVLDNILIDGYWLLLSLSFSFFSLHLFLSIIYFGTIINLFVS